ncbi:MAG: hypothetical protein KAJ49_00165, partial [Arcobacteraceae bacterium]|nr:hypothetical protein [Arcobacteraceae bacterium]
DKQNKDTYFTRTSGIYQIDDADIVIPKENLILIASNNNLSIVDFSTNKIGILKNFQTFDSNITLMKIHPSLNVVYIYMKDSNESKMVIFNFDDSSQLQPLPLSLAEPIMPDINSIHIVDNKFFVASMKFGIQGMQISNDGTLTNCRTLENLGINIQNIFSMDGSTINYTSSKTREDIGQNRDDLNVFFLRDQDIIDGNTDHIYSISTPPKEGCFIATAAYGSYFETHVKVLRNFRDNYLLTNSLGKKFVKLYYTYSPNIATNIAQNEWAKGLVRVILTPIVYIIKYPIYGLLTFLLLMLFIPILKNIKGILK